ncbi:SLC13 family permease [Halolamina litorea]|uniref:SLC13 family permease n=1 Tax=Halolamina litorea TaxID=1515593 RepID=A0ABD6BSG3_9EURY|nr:SLC13 family permease [Halolamina litorea]
MAPITPGTLLVFGLIVAALVLFITEWLPNDITAIGVLVSLVVFEPWTGIGATEALSGFSSPATLTIVAMYMLSEGVQRTGIVSRAGGYLERLTGGDERRILGATVGSTGLAAGVINNTPVVAVLIPMITGLADRNGISPSKLLLPLSYAAMLGGTLTLVGTATNVLASDLAAELLGAPLSMFEFTKLGVVVLMVGTAYLLTVGRWLTPARVDPASDLTEAFDLEDHLARLRVREDSPLVGMTVREATAMVDVATEGDGFHFLQLTRNGEAYLAPRSDQRIEADDVLTVQASRQTVNRVGEGFDLRQLSREEVTEADLSETAHPGALAEVVLPAESRLVGRTVAETELPERFETTVLAVRRSDGVLREGLSEVTLGAGDTLLLQTTSAAVAHLGERGDVVLTQFPDELRPPEEEPEPLDPKTPLALGILIAVIGVAALDLLPVVIAALAGVVVMVATDCLRPSEAYGAVSWNVIFLLAGVIPLGLAMQRTGGDQLLAGLLVASASALPLLVVLGLVYLLTGVLANLITPPASVVLMIPVAVDAAARVGANELTFLLGVMFAGSSAFTTPIGYQTNLMVYGPGGYTFGDYVRVGAPLQLLLAVVTTLGLAFFWGVR